MRSLITLLAIILGSSLCNFTQSQNVIWAKQMGGFGNESSAAVIVDNSGSIYNTGRFEDTADFDPMPTNFDLASFGEGDIFVSKQDASGNLVWAKQFGGKDYDAGTSIKFGSNGDLYVTGYFSDTADFDPGSGTYNLISAGSLDIFICKLDSSGNFIWAKQFGAADFDIGNSIAIDGNDNVFVTGYFSGTIDFDPGVGVTNLSSPYDQVFIVKLDSAGDFVLAKQFGGLGENKGNAIAIDDTGNIYTCGSFRTSTDFDPGPGAFSLTPVGMFPYYTDVFISKLNSVGDFVWAKSIGGVDHDRANAIVLDDVGNIFLTGFFGDTCDFDPGNSNYDLISFGWTDIFIAKLDNSGNFIFANQFGGIGNEEGLSIAIGPNGNIYSAGCFTDACDFDPGSGTYILNSYSSGFDLYFSALDNSGNFISTFSLGHVADDRCTSIFLDNSGNAFLAGSFQSQVDFDPGPNVNILYAFGAFPDIYVMKVSDISSGVSEANFVFDALSVFPNPGSGTISVVNDFVIDEIKVSNLLGEIVFCAKPKEKSVNFNLTNSGIYTVQLISAGKMVVRKVIICK